MRRWLVPALLPVLALGGWFATAHGAETALERPLLMAGKRSLYQRVLARPRAAVRASPETGTASKPIVPFTALYVYAREDGWIQVGVDSHGKTLGWLTEADVIPWNQALTASFLEPLGHDRVMLFRDRESLKTLVDAHDMAGYHRYYREAERDHTSTESPIVAIQPKAHVDIQEDFYLVPILSHEDIYLGNEQGLLLQVASVPLTEEEKPVQPRDYRSGVVFVVDSTASMGPYIHRTREAVQKVYEAIDAAGLLTKASFGLIAYRDNLTAVPGLEYLTRTYATLEEGLTPASFFEQVKLARPSTVSSRGFVEDAYAGVKRAVEEIRWKGYDARYVVLITDAGARPGHDPLGDTGLDAEQLRQLAQDKGVSLWVLHLLTPPGAHNHADAAAQYRSLSYFPGIGNFYYGVTVGDVEEFGRVLETLAAQITREVRETAQGLPPRPIPDSAPSGSPLAEFRRKVARLGYALRMRYLQEMEGTQAPSVFNAWMLDRDFEDPSLSTVEVRALLTRDQLSDLQHVLRQVLETAEEGVLSPRDFLNDLQSLAATIARDPAAVGASTRATGAEGTNLADLGYMREYLEGLPYASEVMKVSLENWEQWPAKQQLQFVHRLESKINYYQAVHDHTDLWTSLDGGPITGDSVFPLILGMLP